MSTRPLVLLAHGSRRPGPSSVMSRTAERVRTILPAVEVRTGYIEQAGDGLDLLQRHPLT